MADKLTQVARLFAENEQAEALLKDAKTKEDALSILSRFGINITPEELTRIGQEVLSDELSEDMLELVAGGGVNWSRVWRNVRDFFMCGPLLW